MSRDEHLEAEWLALFQGVEREGRALWREAMERVAEAANDPDGAGAQRFSHAFTELFEASRQAAEAEDPTHLDAAFEGLREQLEAAFSTLQGAALPLATALNAFDGADDAGGAPPPWIAPWIHVTAARLGPWRQHQERLHALTTAQQRYQEAALRCVALLQGAARGGLTRFQQRLYTAVAEGAPPDSLRELYTVWVDESEHAYESLLEGEEWSEAFGAYSNAAAELLQAVQEQADAWLGLFDFPTRRDWLDAQRRLVELERAQRGLVHRTELDALRGEIERLQRELAAARGESHDPAGRSS